MDRLVTLVLVRFDGTTLGAQPTFSASTPWTERRYHEADVRQRLRDTARRAIEERS
jgi:hypothetical protein